MQGRVWRTLAELVLVLALGVVAAVVFFRTPAKQAGDEANWLGTARYFLVLFVRHDLSAEAWADSYWTRTQPMVPRYVMGGWLWARGLDFEWLDPDYDHTKKWFTNEREGKAPTAAILTEARLPMRALTVVAALLLYGIVRLLAGPVGGAAAALLFCGSSYVPLHMVRAMGEPPFVAFLLAALLVSLLAVGRGGARGPTVGLGLLAGVLLGLAFASKLTAVIAILALVLWGTWACCGAALASRPPPILRAARTDVTPPATDGRRRLLWALGVVVVAFVTFVATNPFLYRDPLGRTWLLFANRQTEMAAQAAADPSRAVTSLPERMWLVWKHSLIEDTWAHTRLRWPLEAVLAAVGFTWLAARAVRLRPSADGLLLLWVLGLFGGVTAGLGYVLDHYFMPTATMGLLLGGLAVGWSSRLAWTAARLAARRRRPAGPQLPRRIWRRSPTMATR